jgi:hypothetical protein
MFYVLNQIIKGSREDDPVSCALPVGIVTEEKEMETEHGWNTGTYTDCDGYETFEEAHQQYEKERNKYYDIFVKPFTETAKEV